MRCLWLIPVLLGCGALAEPSMDDNKLPTDQELLGQPEEISLLALPSDEESFNTLNAIFVPPKTSTGSGTFHFVSSSFPEIDARGFHESVFDGIGDYFPSWPKAFKKDFVTPPYSPSILQQLGLHYSKRSRYLKQDYNDLPKSYSVRQKRNIYYEGLNSTPSSHASNILPTSEENYNNVSTNHLKIKRDIKDVDQSSRIIVDQDWRGKAQSVDVDDKRSGNRHVRGMEMGSSGFHGDTFNGEFGDFTTMRRRSTRKGSLGFHSDTFSDGFGDFQTMKRTMDRQELLDTLRAYLTQHKTNTGDDNKSRSTEDLLESEDSSKASAGDSFTKEFGEYQTLKKRRPEMDSMGFHGDTFSRGFGEFDTLKKRRPEMDSMGFHGDTFNRGFGEFDVYKKHINTRQGNGEVLSSGAKDGGYFDMYTVERLDKS